MSYEELYKNKPNIYSRIRSTGEHALDFFNMYFSPNQSASKRAEAFHRERDEQDMRVEEVLRRINGQPQAIEIACSDRPFEEVQRNFLARAKEYLLEDDDRAVEVFALSVGTLDRLMDGTVVGVFHSRTNPAHEEYVIVDPEWLNDTKFVLELALTEHGKL